MSGEILKKSLFVLLSGTIVGVLLLTLAYMLPVSLKNKTTSVETIENEGWYPRAFVSAASYDTYFHSYFPDVLDGATDRIMLYTAMDTNGGNPFLRALESYNEYLDANYTYYWHGYVCILRPLLLLFDYSEIRVLNNICQLFLVLFLSWVIGKEKGIHYVFMLGTSYLLLNPNAVSMSLQFTWVFYIAYIGTLVLLLKSKYFSTRYRYVYLFIVFGMLTSYFDLLTYPLFTWGMPLVWWLVMDRFQSAKVKGSGGNGSEALFYVKRVIVSGFAWIAGYACMWIMKWAIATPILGRNIFEMAISEVFFRAGASETSSFGLLERLEVIRTNWTHYEYKLYAGLLVCWLLWWFCNSLKNGACGSCKRYAYFLTGISSIVWYLTFANHTQGHHFFTYRIMGVSVLAFLALVLDSTPPASNKRLSETWTIRSIMPEKKKICCIWVAAVLLSIPLMLLARENLLVMNGYAEFKTIPIPQNAIVEVEFTPTFNEIWGLSIGLECAGTQGEYEITLWEGENLRDRQIISIGENAEEYYQNVDIRWKLNCKKSYRLTIEAKDNDEPFYLWVTEDKQGPLTEYHDLSVDGEAIEGQLLSGITYHCLPVSKKTLLFLSLTWTGILAAVMYTFGSDLFRQSEN